MKRTTQLTFGLAAVLIAILIEARAGVTNTPSSNARILPKLMFTTEAYRKEALRLVIQEANKVAQELKLPEQLPINDTNLLQCYISPYGMSRFKKTIGNVTTSNYTYYCSIGDKFSFLERSHQDSDRLKWYREYSWPISQLDTNAAYQLATQWLADVSMDVNGLNRDCNVYIRPSGVTGQGATARFLPLYWVYWAPGPDGFGSKASVGLFLPTKTLLDLRVEDSKYILRKPLQFTNLDYLLSQTNAPAEMNLPAK
ncbi:MAG: hypothetical protein ABSD57_00565 [Verrucomicrobiota bacterium]|jgi:hypothetical protein